MWTWGRGLSAPDASAPADEPVPGKAGFASAAASGSAWTTLQTVANKFVTVFAMLVLARLLTPAEFGLASL
ncbi:MAG: lipopolysaccharide biosynthesis protein, partial [Planctomycetota bacterium]